MEITDTIDNLKKSEIAKSPIHGNGLFSVERIPKGEILGYLDGQEVSWEIYKKYQLCSEWNAITDTILLVRSYRTKYSYINHSRTPNLSLHYNPLRVVAKRDILPGEELTLDYRQEPLPQEYLEGHGKTYL